MISYINSNSSINTWNSRKSLVSAFCMIAILIHSSYRALAFNTLNTTRDEVQTFANIDGGCQLPVCCLLFRETKNVLFSMSNKRRDTGTR